MSIYFRSSVKAGVAACFLLALSPAPAISENPLSMFGSALSKIGESVKEGFSGGAPGNSESEGGDTSGSSLTGPQKFEPLDRSSDSVLKSLKDIHQNSFILKRASAKPAYNYLDGILKRIAAHGPVPSFVPEIHLSGHRGALAVTHDSGDIVIGYQMLRNMPSDEGIAFLLAHEYAHGLLGHRSPEASRALENYGLFFMEQVLARYTGGNKLRAVFQAYGGHVLLRDIALPAWTRSQESDADELALDIIVAAGYNPSIAVSDAFAVLRHHEEQSRKLVAGRVNRLEKAFGVAADGSAPDVPLEPKSIAEVDSVLSALPAKFIEEVRNTFGGSHDEADDRWMTLDERSIEKYRSALDRNESDISAIENMRRDMKAVFAFLDGLNEIREANFAQPQGGGYKVSRLRALQPGGYSSDPAFRYAMAMLRAKSGSISKAIENIRLAEPVDPRIAYFPLDMELAAARWRMQGGRSGEAWDRLSKAVEYYDYPLQGYSELIAIAKKLGMNQEAERLRLACLVKYPSDAMEKACGDLHRFRIR